MLRLSRVATPYQKSKRLKDTFQKKLVCKAHTLKISLTFVLWASRPTAQFMAVNRMVQFMTLNR
jgi:hypothetical protein